MKKYFQAHSFSQDVNNWNEGCFWNKLLVVITPLPPNNICAQKMHCKAHKTQLIIFFKWEQMFQFVKACSQCIMYSGYLASCYLPLTMPIDCRATSSSCKMKNQNKVLLVKEVRNYFHMLKGAFDFLIQLCCMVKLFLKNWKVFQKQYVNWYGVGQLFEEKCRKSHWACMSALWLLVCTWRLCCEFYLASLFSPYISWLLKSRVK